MDEKNLNENTIEEQVLENEVAQEQPSQNPDSAPKSPKSKKAILIGAIALVAIVAIVAFVLILGNKECEHQWGEYSILTDANCVAEGVKERKCAECGEIESEVIASLGHNWENATCTLPQTCKSCGETVGEALGHKDANFDHVCDNECGKIDMGEHSDSATDTDHLCDYGCGAVLNDCVDSTEDDNHNCDVCGKANVSQHDYSDEIMNNSTLKNTASCNEAETYYYTCNCGDISDSETFTSGTALGHSYELESEVAATCEAPASATYKCACGDTYTETIGDKLEHNIDGVTPVEKQISGCEYALVYTCDREGCGAEIVGETQYRHTFVASVSKYPTCIEEGLKILTCACGKTEEEVIEAEEELPEPETEE